MQGKPKKILLIIGTALVSLQILLLLIMGEPLAENLFGSNGFEITTFEFLLVVGFFVLGITGLILIIIDVIRLKIYNSKIEKQIEQELKEQEKKERGY